MRTTRRRYQKSILACEDALTLSRDLNTAGLSSAITLCTELLTDYAAHVADQGDSAGEHKALHTAGSLASAVAPTSLATLLTRVNDASGGWRFRFSQWIDRRIAALQGHRFARTWCRPLSEWRLAFESRGFVVEALPMSSGTPFANVMLICRVK